MSNKATASEGQAVDKVFLNGREIRDVKMFSIMGGWIRRYTGRMVRDPRGKRRRKDIPETEHLSGKVTVTYKP